MALRVTVLDTNIIIVVRCTGERRLGRRDVIRHPFRHYMRACKVL